ncbi:MAG: signal recognition particle-docking protein FtsY [Acidimicrobiales bacterium]
MIALWIVLGVVVVVGLGTIVATRSRRRPPAVAPGAPRQTVRAPSEEVAAPPAVAIETATETPLRDRLGRARGLFGPLRALGARADAAAAYEVAEEALLRADVGVETTAQLLADVRVNQAQRDGAAGVRSALAAELVEVFAHNADRSLHIDDEPGVVNVWLFVGVNGVGKTTSIGKVALARRNEGHSVLLAAGDTFRAAAADQLEVWAERAGVEIVRGAEGGDPSSVVFDAVQRAKARGNELVLADTAGRLHTKVNLVEELAKIRRVSDREPGRVSEVLLVLDATTGQNGLVQAREFTEAVGVTGVILTKLDSTAKGGVVISIERQLGLPVKLVGVGEGSEDMIPFDPEAFVDALVGE